MRVVELAVAHRCKLWRVGVKWALLCPMYVHTYDCMS